MTSCFRPAAVYYLLLALLNVCPFVVIYYWHGWLSCCDVGKHPEYPLMMGSEAGTLATMTYCVRRRRHRTRHQQPDMPVMCCYKIITVKFYVVMELC